MWHLYLLSMCQWEVFLLDITPWFPVFCKGRDGLGLPPCTNYFLGFIYLSIVLEGLAGHPFEPLESMSDKFLTLKTLFGGSILDLGRGTFLRLCRILLKQLVLEAFPPPDSGTESDVQPLGLCPVRALKIYVNRTV